MAVGLYSGVSNLGWLRGVDLNHRPLGYECNHQRNPKTMRGAKSNALFLRRTNRNPACPCVALVISQNPDAVVGDLSRSRIGYCRFSPGDNMGLPPPAVPRRPPPLTRPVSLA